MSRSTPIEQLPQNGGTGGSTDLVKDILDQMENENNEVEAEYNKKQNEYQEHQFGVNPAGDFAGVEEEDDEPIDDYDEPYGFKDRILNEIKPSVIVAVLFFALNQPLFTGILKKALARFSDNPYVSIIILVAKSLIAGLAFYLLRRFV